MHLNSPSRLGELNSLPQLRREAPPRSATPSTPRPTAQMEDTESKLARSSTAQTLIPRTQSTVTFRSPSATEVDASRDPRLNLQNRIAEARPTQPRCEPSSILANASTSQQKIDDLTLRYRDLEQQVRQLCNMTYCLAIPTVAKVAEAYVNAATHYSRIGTSLPQEAVESNLRLIEEAIERHRSTYQQTVLQWASLEESHKRLLSGVMAIRRQK
ncbi:MAG: hypothetical protein Q9180_000695 [Flavoplaca navasiana]